MLYCVNKDKVEKTVGAKTAGKKAPDDITYLTGKLGGRRVSFMQDDSTIKLSVLRKTRNMYYSFKDWHGLYKKVHRNDIVVIQHPYEGIQAGIKYIPRMQKKGARIVCLIHDIRVLRDSIDDKAGALTKNKSNAAEVQLLTMCDFIIAHNASMKKFLVDNFNLDRRTIYELGIFDYICSNKEKERTYDRSIAVAGNLSMSKCSYLYKVLEKDIISNPFHLYGPNYSGKSDKVIYHGVVSPSELPAVMEGSFGLVWDGDEIDRCGGIAGEYLKYNNPHKCSLYLAAGVPVIIWSKAALAGFVEKNGCGIVVDSLLDVNEKINNISSDQYNELLKNTNTIRTKLVNGENYIGVMKKIMRENNLS